MLLVSILGLGRSLWFLNDCDWSILSVLGVASDRANRPICDSASVCFLVCDADSPLMRVLASSQRLGAPGSDSLPYHPFFPDDPRFALIGDETAIAFELLLLHEHRLLVVPICLDVVHLILIVLEKRHLVLLHCGL